MNCKFRACESTLAVIIFLSIIIVEIYNDDFVIISHGNALFKMVRKLELYFRIL